MGNGSVSPEQLLEPVILKSLAAKVILKISVSSGPHPHVLACTSNGQLFRWVNPEESSKFIVCCRLLTTALSRLMLLAGAITDMVNWVMVPSRAAPPLVMSRHYKV